MKLKTIVFVIFIIITSSSCNKNNDSSNDYASKVAGKYGGAIPPGLISGNLVLSRQSSTNVTIELTTSTGYYKQYGIGTVNDGGGGNYNISLTTSSDTIIGVANDTLFRCFINSRYFYGVKL